MLSEVSSSSAKEISILESGTDKPFSHFDMVCLTTFSLLASSSCDSPFAFRKFLIFSFNIACASDRKSTRLNSSHVSISYAVFCLKKKKKHNEKQPHHPA